MANTHRIYESLNFKSRSILKLLKETCIIDFLGKHEEQEEYIKEEFFNKVNNGTNE